MKRPLNGMSFRTKLLLASGLTILLAVTIVTGLLTYETAQMTSGLMRSNLELLTEQSLRNFQSETEAIQRQLINQLIGKMVPNHMYMLRDMSLGEIGYSEKVRGLVGALNQTISPTCGYDRIYVKLCQLAFRFPVTVTFCEVGLWRRLRRCWPVNMAKRPMERPLDPNGRRYHLPHTGRL